MRPSAISPRTLCGALVVATLAGTALGAPAPKNDAIRWTNGITDQVVQMPKPQLSQAISELSARQDATRVLVSLSRPLSANERADLEAQGLTLLNSLGSTHHFATLSKTANADALSSSIVTNISQVQNYQKLHTDLLTGIIRPWAVSNLGAISKTALAERVKNESLLIEEFTQVGIDPVVAVVVMFHKDANYKTESARLANELGARVASEIYTVNSAILHMPASKINDLASDDAVMWAEPPLPPMGELNAENRILTGVNTLQTAPYDLDGQGVVALIYDAGRMANHADIDGRMTVGTSDTAGISDHATHVGGTVGGDGTASSGNNRGMAPAVDIISYGFEQEGGLQEGFLYTDPGDIEADYTEAINLYGVDISNNSIGTNTAPNGYPCEWTGNYGITSALIDSIAAGSLGNPFRIVWANGNERQSFRCQGDDNGNHGEFYSTAPPACAKNHIAVGSVDADTDLTSSFSSWGPTDDGRIKPDISAPGCQAGGDGGVTSLSSFGFTSYGNKCGTSMAAPTVTGISALILQQYRDTFPDRDDLRNSTLKALLANTADDSGNPGPDYRYGYGSVRAIDAVDTVIAENIVESELAQGGTYQGVIIVEPGQTELRVTIAWDDAPATPNAAIALVNDLDLRIIDSNGTPYLPWTLDPNNPNANAVQSGADHLNNIEQVSIMNPAPGAYTVEVTGFNIPQGPTQSFGVVSSSTLINCSSAGIVSMGNNIFSCDASTTVQVVDCDLNTSDILIETVDVTIASNSSSVVVTLTETSPESATFTGGFTFSDSGSADIIVSDGDTLTASYLDLDDGKGNMNLVVASASIDCASPLLSNVAATNIGSSTATLVVDTDEPTLVSFTYGPTMLIQEGSVDSMDFSTSHSIDVFDLSIHTNYVFVVQAEDAAGNITFDNNNGLGFPFTTENGPSPIYEFLVDDTSPGWETTGDWEFGQPAGFDGDPSSGSTGNNVYGYNLSGDYQNNLPERFLTSEVLDFTGVTEVSLNFERWLGMESATYDQAAIEVRQGEGSWQTIWNHTGGSFQNSSWAPHSYDISGIADNQSDIQVRWVMGTTDVSVTYSGWNLDDIVFVGVVPISACDADINGDGVLDFFDISEFLRYFSALNPIADINGDGEYDFFDISGYLSLYSAGCP